MRNETIVGMSVEGASQREIATAVGLTQPMVCKILRAFNERVLERTSEKLELLKSKQAARCEFLYRQAITGWKDSRRPTKKVKRKRVTGEKSGVESSKEFTTTAGDPRFLVTALGCLEAERKIWSLDALEWDPTLEAVTDPDAALEAARERSEAKMDARERRKFREWKVSQAEAALAKAKAALETTTEEE